jgi:hypothetical protein
MKKYIDQNSTLVDTIKIEGNKLFIKFRNADPAFPFAEFAKTDRVLIVRRKGNAEVPLFVDFKKLAQGEDLAQNLILHPGDTIVVQ